MQALPTVYTIYQLLFLGPSDSGFYVFTKKNIFFVEYLYVQLEKCEFQ